MCLLTYLPAGVQPDTEALRNGTLVNEDGFGYAIVADGRIIIGKSLDPDKTIDRFAELRKANPDGPALFHSRMSTHGIVDKDNCHPFIVGGDRRTVFGHNGIFPAKAQPAKNDIRSDTRIVAEDLIPRGMWGGMQQSKSRRRLERWMGPFNKAVILTVNRRYREQAYILNEDAGIWDKGSWYSNSGFKPPWKPSKDDGYWTKDPETGTWGFTSRNWNYGGHDCPVCFTDDAVDPVTNICGFCHCCIDCCETDVDCQCYIPAALDRLPDHILSQLDRDR